jgi:membrane protein implicated in regulation of membrane protease activity
MQTFLFILLGIMLLIAAVIFVSFWKDMSHRFKEHTGKLQQEADAYKG